MALKTCEGCKKEIVIYANETTACPHCSYKHTGDQTLIKPIFSVDKINVPRSDKQFWALVFFYFFFQGIGAHRIYVGKILSGLMIPLGIINMFIVWVIFADEYGNFNFSGNGSIYILFSWIIGFFILLLLIYDFFLILLGQFEDANGRYITADSYDSNIKEPKTIQTNNPPQNNLHPSQEIKKYSELRDEGIITEEEFNKKKQELLK
jgi:TM2 domain-containing membrane protein YozV